MTDIELLAGDRFEGGTASMQQLEMAEGLRRQKRGKFGALKYVYPAAVMSELRAFLSHEIETALPTARLLYFT